LEKISIGMHVKQENGWRLYIDW